MTIIHIQTLKSVIILLLSHLCSTVFCDNESLGGKTPKLSDNVQYGFCDGSPEPLNIRYLHYEPWPLLMVKGEQVSVLAHIEVFQEIPANSIVSIEMVKTADGVNITIPCSNITNSDGSVTSIGSCDYDANSFLTNPLFSVFPALFCDSESMKAHSTPRPPPPTPPPDMWAGLQSNCSALHSQECELPICPGHYGSDWDEPYSFNITDEVILQLDWLLSGTFFIRARITNGKEAEYTCLEFVMEMTQDEEQEVTTEKEEGNFCDQCLSEYDRIVTERFLVKEWMDEQRKFVFNEACADSSEPSCCQQFIGLDVENNWQKIAECIYNDKPDWNLGSLACQYIGSCEHHTIYWGCYEVMSLIGSTLSNGVMVDGGTDHLKRCLNNTVTMPDPCQHSNVTSDQLLEEITGPVFSSLASWLETNDDGVCSVSGSDLVQISRVLLTIVALLQLLSLR